MLAPQATMFFFVRALIGKIFLALLFTIFFGHRSLFGMVIIMLIFLILILVFSPITFILSRLLGKKLCFYHRSKWLCFAKGYYQ